MPISITVMKSSAEGIFPNTDEFNFNDNAVDRLVVWAKQAYPNPVISSTPGSSEPGPKAALQRWAKALVDGTKNNIERQEYTNEVAAVPQPPPIDTSATLPSSITQPSTGI